MWENGSLGGYRAFGDKGNSSLTQDTRISGKPSAESRADSESKAFTESIPTDSESKKLTESTTLKNPSRALPNTKK